MKKLMLVLLVLSMAVTANAATVWNPAANGISPPDVANWGDAANWTNEVPGVNDTKAVFNVNNAAECQITSAQTVKDLVQGDGGYGSVIRITNSATFSTTGGWTGIGYNNTAHLIVETGAAMNIAGHLWTGIYSGATSTIDISGLVSVGGNLGIGSINAVSAGGGAGTINVLDGGVLALDHWNGDGNGSIQAGSLIDINGTGTITLQGDWVNSVDNYIANDRLAGNGIIGNVDATFTNGVTTITAVPEPLTMSLLGLGGMFIVRRRRSN
ncbi:MAG: PEP-CTERM sorting domain-containing protein [Phycisphaerae bacterium]|nr:PEP-CTERM sorting domain-containing protein [Phycisphaerae bacterium]